MSLKKDLQGEGCFPGLKNHSSHNWPQIPAAQVHQRAQLHIAPICQSETTFFWATDFMYKLPEVRDRAVASLSSMNRLYSGNKFSIIPSTEEGKTITQAGQLQPGKHEHNFEFAWACMFHDTDEYTQAKKSENFFWGRSKKMVSLQKYLHIPCTALSGHSVCVCRHEPAELALLWHKYCWW